MKANLIEITVFLAVIILNLLFYKDILRFFRKIYASFEKKPVNQYGIVCPVALRHWPKGFNYVVLDKRKSFYRAYFFDKEPELHKDEDGVFYWYAKYPYQVQSFIDIPFGPATKFFDEQYLGNLKWSR